MAKARSIVVSIAVIIYLILFFMKVEIPRNIFFILLSIILINQLIDEWNMYTKTKKKIHLLIPITFLIGVIVIVIFLIFK